MIFQLDFLTLKFWQPLLNELEFVLAELGQALSTENEMFSTKWLHFISFVPVILILDNRWLTGTWGLLAAVQKLNRLSDPLGDK